MSDANRERRTITPPINSRGSFVTYEPFTLPLDQPFKCDAVRTFKELTLRGVDVYAEYYEPKEIPVELYEEDILLEASIVTLKDTDGEFIYIPNTYIESYPGMNGLDYVRTVISLDLNVHLSETIDLDFVKGALNDVIVANVGVETTPYIQTISFGQTVSHDEHVAIEAARHATRSKYIPYEEQIRVLTEKNAILETEIEELLKIIAANPELGESTE